MEIREFCQLIRKERRKKFKTAREFYRINSISCTYAYYSKVENGVVPEITIAIEIISKLKINIRKALHAWVRDQMPNKELKSLFSELDDSPTLSSEQKSIDRSLVINRMQGRLLSQQPIKLRKRTRPD